MSSSGVLNNRELISNAIEHYELNFKRLVVLKVNFAAFSKCTINRLSFLLDGKSSADNSKLIETCFARWYYYWICFRNEYNLVYEGAIVCESQRVDNEDFAFNRQNKEINDNLRQFVHILASSEGIRCWLLHHQKEQDYVDETFFQLQGISDSIDVIEKEVDQIYSDMVAVFTVERFASLSPKTGYSFDVITENLVLRVKDLTVVYSGIHTRNICPEKTRELSIVEKINTGEFCQDGNKTCSESFCVKCGFFKSWVEIVKEVEDERQGIIAEGRLKKEEAQKQLKLIEDKKLKHLKKLEVEVVKARCFTSLLDPPLRIFKTNANFMCLFEAVYFAIAALPSYSVEKKIFGEKKLFFKHFSSQVNSFKTILHHHFNQLVLSKLVRYLEVDLSSSSTFDDYIKQNYSYREYFNFEQGDEFTLKALASFFGLEIQVLCLIPGQENCLLHFNPFIEFPNTIRGSIFLVYYGGINYQFCEKIPSRSTSVICPSDDQQSFYDNVKRINTYFTTHDCVRGIDDDETDNNTSFISLVDRLAPNNDFIKEEIGEIVLNDFKHTQADILKLDVAVFSPDAFVKAPIMDDIFRNVQKIAENDDPFKNLYNAICFAAQAKMYVCYLLETAVTALYFCQKSDTFGGRFRDSVDWLDYVECIKIGQLNRYLVENEHVNQDGKRILLITEKREASLLVIELEDAFLVSNFDSPEEFEVAEFARVNALCLARERLSAVIVKIKAKADKWKKFKRRLNQVMFEICVQLWQIWFRLQNMTESQKEAFTSVNDDDLIEDADVDSDTKSMKTISKYTDNASMTDFHELITTYKDKYNSRKTSDLPKNIKEAKEKHEAMLLLVEQGKIKPGDKRSSSYYTPASDGPEKKRKKEVKKDFVVSDDDVDSRQSDDEDDEGTQALIRQNTTDGEKVTRSKMQQVIKSGSSTFLKDGNTSEISEDEFTSNTKGTDSKKKKEKTATERREHKELLKLEAKVLQEPEINTTKDDMSETSSIFPGSVVSEHDLSLSGSSSKQSTTKSPLPFVSQLPPQPLSSKIEYMEELDSSLENNHKEREILELQEYDKDFGRKAALRKMQLNYPPNTRNGSRVLSFLFGIVPIIYESLGLKHPDFEDLALIVNPNVLIACVSYVGSILGTKHSPEEYVQTLSLAFDLLRDKHIMSVITKVLLLPVIVFMCPDLFSGPSVMKGEFRGKAVNVLVWVLTYEIGSTSALDIERSLNNGDKSFCFESSCTLNYFA